MLHVRWARLLQVLLSILIAGFISGLEETPVKRQPSAAVKEYLEQAAERQKRLKQKQEQLKDFRSALQATVDSRDLSSDSFYSRQYKSESESGHNFEWFSYSVSTQDLGVWIAQRLDSMGQSRDQLHVLHGGCGTSNLTDVLLDMGFTGLVNTDRNQKAVDILSYRNKGRGSYAVADLTDLREYGDATFHAIVEKGALDAMISGGGDTAVETATVQRATKEFSRVLRPGGFLITVTCYPSILDALSKHFDKIQFDAFPRPEDKLAAEGVAVFPEPQWAIPVFGFVGKPHNQRAEL